MHKLMMQATKAVINPDSNKDFRRRCLYLVYKSSNCEFSPAMKIFRNLIGIRAFVQYYVYFLVINEINAFSLCPRCDKVIWNKYTFRIRWNFFPVFLPQSNWFDSNLECVLKMEISWTLPKILRFAVKCSIFICFFFSLYFYYQNVFWFYLAEASHSKKKGRTHLYFNGWTRECDKCVYIFFRNRSWPISVNSCGLHLENRDFIRWTLFVDTSLYRRYFTSTRFYLIQSNI